MRQLLAWVLQARISFLLESDEGLQSALKCIELEPNLADGYAALGRIKHYTGDWVEAESAFRKAFELTNEPSVTMINDFADYYFVIGYFDKMRDLLEKALEKDPLNMWTRQSYLLYLGVKGDIQRAEEEDAHCRALFGDRWNDNANWAITWVRLGSGEVISRDRVLFSDPITDTAKEYLASPKSGLSELRRIFAEDKNLTNGNLTDISIWAAYFDGPEFAMDAVERAFSLTAMRTCFIWLPVMHEVRQLPRFKQFVNKIGLVDYWDKFGWPDMCHQLDNGDFECD
jgi:tetratricopeptide (TPR) repeat protein